MAFGKKRGDDISKSHAAEQRAMKRINKLRKEPVTHESVIKLNNIIRLYLREKFRFSLSLTAEEIIPRLNQKKIKKSIRLDLAHLIVQVYKREYYNPKPITPKELEMLTRIAYTTFEEIQTGHKIRTSSSKKKSSRKSSSSKHKKSSSKKTKERKGLFYRLFTKEVSEEKKEKVTKVKTKKQPKQSSPEVEETTSEAYRKVIAMLESIGSTRDFHADWSNEKVRKLYENIKIHYLDATEQERKILYPSIMKLFHLE